MADDVLESLRTATQLSLADLRDLQALASSSPRYGSSEDEQLAYNLWKEELERFTVTLADRQVAQDLQTALRTGQTLEQREQRSARLAATAHPYRRKTPDSASTSAVPSTVPLASTSGALGHAQRLVSSTPYCISCADEVNGDAAKATCGHLFCRPCLVRLFRLATRDESLFPPSCCKTPIPSTLAMPLLDVEDGKAYRRAVQEYSTPRRLYCSNGKCAVWLGALPASKQDVACGKCGRVTCSACKAPAHDAKVACADDLDGDAALKLAAQVNGVRCPKCHRVVERNGGCPHVTDLQIPAPG
ncbi:hypothetical protein NBRC10512_000611 [Rhodotorula toruloides]|uniref:RBR-type E3 ubiquitin transferase n=2 Tax=Rhodotorula toruloides TaxID=5286 RepID=A0A061ALX3_RHOTO|nr:IBR finger domain containing protein [Rhodotorula toruloides NP11]EMS21777.1 IBR finger domain containing protein [Rhodotorula toruloides NP11]CDR35734.1 RHTO0S01e05952g1_1 [Rhodotorula toruloides]